MLLHVCKLHLPMRRLADFHYVTQINMKYISPLKTLRDIDKTHPKNIPTEILYRLVINSVNK